MTPQLCNFDQSKDLREVGFNWQCHAIFGKMGDPMVFVHGITMLDMPDTWVLRPTIQDAIRWFRVEKGVHGWVESNWHFEGFRFLFSIGTSFYPWKQTFEGFKSHDSAENALLNRLIEISNQG